MIMMQALSDKAFQRKRQNKEYERLGWYFWNGFIFLQGRPREKLSEQWKSLTKQEKRRCEFIA
jgi:hypothetical protein